LTVKGSKRHGAETQGSMLPDNAVSEAQTLD
jgi:hypothetical protein